MNIPVDFIIKECEPPVAAHANIRNSFGSLETFDYICMFYFIYR